MPSDRFPTQSKIPDKRKTPPPKAEQVSAPNFSASLKEYIASYESGKPEGFLREHQQDVFHAIAEFLKTGQKSGYLDLPTGFGKTVVFVELVKAFSRDVGGKKPNLKTLVLVPTQDLVIQTIGKAYKPGDREGFSKFAPDITATPYYDKEKDLSGEVVVSTYQSFINLQRKDPKFADMFQLVILDEAHRALGSATKQQVQAITPNALKIGCTATSEYNDREKRKVTEILPTQIHKMEAREAVELGILANPRGFLYRTHIKIEGSVSSVRDYPPAVYRQLNTEARNQITVDFVKSFVAKGMKGLVPCLPGERGEHARKMATRISKETVMDAKTRQKRNIIARGITQETSRDQRDKIYESFKRGEIDCLTYIDILTTGKDLPNAKFLVRNRPRKSKVASMQETGRLLRPYENEDPYIVEIEDEFPMGLQPYTVFDQFEVSTATQGQTMVDPENVVELPQEQSGTKTTVIPPEKGTRSERPSFDFPSASGTERKPGKTKAEKEKVHKELTAELLGKMKVEAKLVRELKRELKDLYPEAPDGWFTLDTLAKKYNRLGDTVLELIQENVPAKLLKDEVREYSSRFTKARVPRTHYGPKIIELMDPILSHTEEIKSGTMTVNALAADIPAKDRRVKKMAESFRSTHPEWFTFRYSKEAGRDVEVLSKQLVTIIRKKIEKERTAFPEALPGEESAYMIAKRLNTNNLPRIRNLAESFRETHPEWLNMRLSVQGKPAEYYDKQLVKRIEKLF